MHNIYLGYFLSTMRLVIIIFNISFFMGVMWLVFCDLTRDIIEGHGEHESTEISDQWTFLFQYDFQDRSEPFQVLSVMYFSFTSLSTVGFGDFNPKSDSERILCSFFMIFGVAIFSYIMGDFIEILNKFQLINAELDEGDELAKFLGLIKRFNGGKDMSQEFRT